MRSASTRGLGVSDTPRKSSTKNDAQFVQNKIFFIVLSTTFLKLDMTPQDTHEPYINRWWTWCLHGYIFTQIICVLSEASSTHFQAQNKRMGSKDARSFKIAIHYKENQRQRHWCLVAIVWPLIFVRYMTVSKITVSCKSHQRHCEEGINSSLHLPSLEFDTDC